jgi:spore coat polysaccharide biosynthesis protein SpsF (cytidylyltransferase family)
MLNLAGKSILARVIQRAKLAGLPVFVATSTCVEDDVVALEAYRNNISGVYRGPLLDVRQRLFDCARFFGLNRIARLTADNPFSEPAFIKMGFKELNNGARYSRCGPELCPKGTNVEVFFIEELRVSISSDQTKNNQYDMEHVTPEIIKRATKNGTLVNFNPLWAASKKISEYSFTVDTPDDYIKLVRFCESSNISELNFNSKQLIDIAASRILNLQNP